MFHSTLNSKLVVGLLATSIMMAAAMPASASGAATAGAGVGGIPSSEVSVLPTTLNTCRVFIDAITPPPQTQLYITISLNNNLLEEVGVVPRTQNFANEYAKYTFKTFSVCDRVLERIQLDGRVQYRTYTR